MKSWDPSTTSSWSSPPARRTSPARWRRSCGRWSTPGTIRVLDLIVLEKDENGEVEGYEIEDLGDLGELATLETSLAEILALDDVDHLAAAMEPGSAAGVLVWENSWAAPFAVAARQSGGQLIASGRIPTQALIAAFEADAASTEGA